MQQTARKGTQSRLLEAAANLMWERSYQATSVDDLCQRAEAKKGSFYHFFASKTDLAIAAVEQLWTQAEEQLFKPIFCSDASGLEQLQMLVDTIHTFQVQAAEEKGDYLGCPFGNLGQEMAHQNEHLRLTLERIFNAHYDYLEGALDKAVLAGDLAQGENRLRAQRIFAMLEGTMMLAKVSNDPQIFQRVGPTLMAIAAT